MANFQRISISFNSKWNILRILLRKSVFCVIYADSHSRFKLRFIMIRLWIHRKNTVIHAMWREKILWKMENAVIVENHLEAQNIGSLWKELISLLDVVIVEENSEKRRDKIWKNKKMNKLFDFFFQRKKNVITINNIILSDTNNNKNLDNLFIMTYFLIKKYLFFFF